MHPGELASRMFWPGNDLAPLLRWRRHCTHRHTPVAAQWSRLWLPADRPRFNSCWPYMNHWWHQIVSEKIWSCAPQKLLLNTLVRLSTRAGSGMKPYCHFCSVKIVPEITCNVFGRTLNLAQSINLKNGRTTLLVFAYFHYLIIWKLAQHRYHWKCDFNLGIHTRNHWPGSAGPAG